MTRQGRRIDDEQAAIVGPQAAGTESGSDGADTRGSDARLAGGRVRAGTAVGPHSRDRRHPPASSLSPDRGRAESTRPNAPRARAAFRAGGVGPSSHRARHPKPSSSPDAARRFTARSSGRSSVGSGPDGPPRVTSPWSSPITGVQGHEPTALILQSATGASIETLDAARHAAELGVLTVAMTNTQGSVLEELCDEGVCFPTGQRCGPDVSVLTDPALVALSAGAGGR